MSEAEHLPDRKTKSDTDLVIETFVDDMLEIYPNLDREEFREAISGYVQEYVPEEDEGEEEEKGLTDKAKGLLRKAAEAVGAGGSSREEMRSIIRESVERSQRGRG